MTDFDQFWIAYPRKKGKGAARTAFAKALKVATVEEIMAGVENLTAEIELNATEPQFIPHASTWLNQERWDDEYETGYRLSDDARRLATAIQHSGDRGSLGSDSGSVARLVQRPSGGVPEGDEDEHVGEAVSGPVLSLWGRTGVRGAK